MMIFVHIIVHGPSEKFFVWLGATVVVTQFIGRNMITVLIKGLGDRGITDIPQKVATLHDKCILFRHAVDSLPRVTISALMPSLLAPLSFLAVQALSKA